MLRHTAWSRLLRVFLLFATLSSSACRSVNRQQYKLIERYMDPSVDPCHDFYQYACGNWEQQHASDDYFETIGLIDYKVNHEYARILNALRKERRGTEHRFVRDVLDYYRGCMFIDHYEPAQYLHWLTRHEKITWPSVLPKSERRMHSNTKQDYDWLRLLATLRKYGLNGIMLEETVLQRRNDALASLIDLDKPVLNGGFQLLKFKAFKLVLEYLDVTKERRIEALWAETQLFEVRLLSLDDIEDDETAETKARLVAELHTELPWLRRYLSTLLNGTLDEQMQITVQNLPYMKALFELLDEYEPEFVCRYLMVRFLWHLNVEGPRNFLKNDCVAHTRSVLPLAMHWLYEQHHPELKDETPHIEALFRQLTQHFAEALNRNNHHFNATVLQFLHSKVASMHIKVGNLPRPNTVDRLEDFHASLAINVSDFYGNHLRALRHYFDAKHALLHTALPAALADFFHLEDAETGASSSPYYLLRSNVVILPLTLLHAPIYQRQLHDIFKYSSLGFLLAHEITHGFDDSGVEFDEHGNMRGPAQLIRANEHFGAQLDCLRAKNSAVIDEKIADVSGVRWAYEAYFKNASAQGDGDASLGWAALPPRRLFFLNFAQFFCGALSPAITDTLDYNEHGSDRQRVLDTLANFAEFGRVYECPVGSRMHPQKKCQLWR